MEIFKNSGMRIILITSAAVLLIVWMIPAGVLFAEDDAEEEILLEELNIDSDNAEGEEGIEVLGFTEEDVPILSNKVLIAVVAIVAAAVGGLFLSFVIRGRT